jgi:hypothetical protein
MVVRFLMSATFRNLHCCRAERVFICTFEEVVQVRSSNWKTSGKPNQIRVRLIFTENFTNFVVAVSSPAKDQAVSTLTNFLLAPSSVLPRLLALVVPFLAFVIRNLLPCFLVTFLNYTLDII